MSITMVTKQITDNRAPNTKKPSIEVPNTTHSTHDNQRMTTYPVVSLQQDVAWLDVHVHHALRMDVLHAVGDAQRDLQPLERRGLANASKYKHIQYTDTRSY